jgi:hypothetical protein
VHDSAQHSEATPAPRQGPTVSAPSRVLPAGLLALNQMAGNRAVARFIASGGPRAGRRATDQVVVQRHNSYEHQLMGDTKPQDVKNAKTKFPEGSDAWRHIVEEELQRVMYFQNDPGRDPREDYPSIRWTRLSGSQLWVSPGELSAFGDYLPNPETIDTSDRSLILPVLQRMRQEIARALAQRLGTGEADWEGATDPRNNDPEAYADYKDFQRKTAFKGAAGKFVEHDYLPTSARQITDLDSATAGLGPNRQKGLTARNACHFAPFSWERWALYHNQARDEAKKAYASGGGRRSLAMRTNPDTLSDPARKAWVNNGYSNHFLQDSFAAGHLINKTLVMQWFVEYNNSVGWAKRPHFGIPSEEVMHGLTTAAQPDVAGRHLYDDHRLHTSASEDEASGSTEADPQTTLERGSDMGRLAGSGVKGGQFDYQDFAAFLNSSYLQLSANDIHDYLNEHGLRVENDYGHRFVIGGDGTLLLEDGSSIEVNLEADSLADQAITDILTTGDTHIDQDKIFKYFPVKVVLDPKDPDGVPLEKWNDTLLKQICYQRIFPQMASKFDYKLVRIFGAKMVDAPNDRIGGGVMSPQDSGDW